MALSGTLMSIFAGIGLAAAAGFRVFLPLLVLSLAAKFHIIGLNEKFAWLGSDVAVLILGIATLVEILAYLIPYVDHLLDMIALPLAGIAGTMAMASTLQDTDPALTWALALIAGGGTAAAVHTSTATTRAASTATTGGLANPLVSTVESVMSFLVSLLAVLAPVLAVLVLGLLFWGVYKLFKRRSTA